MKHKWAEIIKAWADGADIEYRYVSTETYRWTEWKNFHSAMGWTENEDWEYRIKPKKSDVHELTDGEIEKTWHELYPLDSNNYWEDMRRGCCQLRFARAILKKASEK